MRVHAILIGLAACTTAPTKRSGQVSLTSRDVTSPGAQAGYADARFYTIEFPEISTSAPCELDDYNSPQFPDGKLNAGVIAISGTSTAFTLTPEASVDFVSYPQYNATMPLFSGGEALTISASGADVPAFTQQLVAPGRIVVTAPAPSQEITIPIHQDFAIAWTGGNGLVQVSMGDIGSGEIALCQFPAVDGTGVIPHKVLERIWKKGTFTEFAIDSVASVHVPLDDWRVDVSATFSGVSGYVNLLE